MPIPLLFPILQVLALGAGAAYIGYKEWYEPNYGVPELPTPSEVPPAAPQSRAQLTQPTAWNPETMYAQTQANRQLAQQYYREGYQAGGGTPAQAGSSWTEQLGDFLQSDEAMYAALVVGAVLILDNMGKKGRRR